MALLENNVRRRLSYLYFMERNLNLFCSTKITQIHATITLEDDIIKMMEYLKLFSCLFLC
jgi:hypothetical protein